MEGNDFTALTEVAGDDVTREQIQRLAARYAFAGSYCRGKDVLEVACGSGQGLGYLAKLANSVIGGDYTENLLKMARAHYGDRVPLVRLDGHHLPFPEARFDVVILFEAIYYLDRPEDFVREATRVLRPGGTILICNPNKDLPDFNPSPRCVKYFNAREFEELLRPLGYEVECFGDCPVDYSGLKQKCLSGVKSFMVKNDLMPKTMAGKKLFKRIVFGALEQMPPEIREEAASCPLPTRLPSREPVETYKVIFSAARLP